MYQYTIIGGSFGGVYGGGSYPGYSSTTGSGISAGSVSSSIGPYPSDNIPGGYWGHVGGHGADIPPFLGQGAGGIGSNFGFGSTPSAIGSSIPPYTPSAIPGGLPPIGGPPLGPSLLPGYYPGGSGGGGGGGIGSGGISGINGIDGNRPFNIRCDENDGFKQVIVFGNLVKNRFQN